MKIEILGTGCQKCNALAEAAKKAASELGINSDFSKVEDFKEIMKYGVMSTPALVVNGKVVVSGRVPSFDEVKTILKSAE